MRKGNTLIPVMVMVAALLAFGVAAYFAWIKPMGVPEKTSQKNGIYSTDSTELNFGNQVSTVSNIWQGLASYHFAVGKYPTDLHALSIQLPEIISYCRSNNRTGAAMPDVPNPNSVQCGQVVWSTAWSGFAADPTDSYSNKSMTYQLSADGQNFSLAYTIKYYQKMDQAVSKIYVDGNNMATKDYASQAKKSSWQAAFPTEYSYLVKGEVEEPGTTHISNLRTAWRGTRAEIAWTGDNTYVANVAFGEHSQTSNPENFITTANTGSKDHRLELNIPATYTTLHFVIQTCVMSDGADSNGQVVCTESPDAVISPESGTFVSDQSSPAGPIIGNIAIAQISGKVSASWQTDVPTFSRLGYSELTFTDGNTASQGNNYATTMAQNYSLPLSVAKGARYQYTIDACSGGTLCTTSFGLSFTATESSQ